MNTIHRFRDKYNQLLADTQIPLTQSRIRILTYGLLLLITLTLIVLINSFTRINAIVISRLVILMLSLVVALYVLIEKGMWRQSGHILLLALCIYIWTNLIFFKFGINLVTIQLSLIIISASFYILGKNWGIIYSLANVIPVLAYIISTRMQGGKVSITAVQIHNNSFMLALTVNFGILIIMHYEFFKSFYQSHHAERELNSKLENALKEAQEATKLRSDFLSSMSHELRTPLHAVIGMINVLSIENPRKDQEENLAILRFSAENLLALINDTLDFSKMNEDKIVLNNSAFNLNALLQNLHASFKARAEQKGVDLRLRTDFENIIDVNGDQNRLTQILNNLISNAVKFTESSGRVEINVITVARSENHIVLLFAVKDSGIGIPKNKQDIIFEPFLQANNNITKRYGGTGLGLAIAKRLISMHESELKLVSEENVGSVFSFEIRYELAAAEEMTEQKPVITAAPTDISNLSILIAEDNIINIMLLKKILDQWNCSYSLSKNGQEALEMVKTGEFDVVLMDIHMPVMDGFEASRHIRELPDATISKIKIIALTASSDVDIQQSFNFTYLDDYLLKPFSPSLLKEKLEAVVQQLTTK
ncbi:ATP-binding protein [Pedobacter sp. L105]|uniref:ATP-binding protein n=1 Tax=Pedobacter sp. L105 TaxID=1641871 RepID=UPI00131AE445|nr:ATP-binding protein [Pedobacter sp. L105]